MDDLLQESGDHLLQEDNFFILLESQASEPSTYQTYLGVFSVVPKPYRGWRY